MNPKLLASLTPSSLRDRANTRREREKEMEEQNWENAHERESELARSEGKKSTTIPVLPPIRRFCHVLLYTLASSL